LHICLQGGGITVTLVFYSFLNSLHGFVHIFAELYFRVDQGFPYPLRAVTPHNKPVTGVHRQRGNFFEFLESGFYPGLDHIDAQPAAHIGDYFIGNFINNRHHNSNGISGFSVCRIGQGILHPFIARLRAVNVIHYFCHAGTDCSRYLARISRKGPGVLAGG